MISTRLKGVFRPFSFAILAFLSLFLLTQIAYHETKRRSDQQEKERFQARTNQLSSAIIRRFGHYTQILKGAQGLLLVNKSIERNQWRKYCEVIEANKNYPGIQGIGYAPYLRTQDLKPHYSAILAEGFSKYQIYPAGNRPEYVPITYLEPIEGRNLRAVGFDMFSEPTRKRAMQVARDSNSAVLTGKVTLVQETQADVQPGFLLYLPVYEGGIKPISVYERRQKIQGYVYCPFRARDVINGIIGNSFEDLDVEIYDSSEATIASLLYGNEKNLAYFQPKDQSRHYRLSTLTIHGRPWTIYFTSTPQFGSAADRDLANLILAGGSVISCLLFIALWILSQGQMTAQIKQTITDHSSAALFMIDSKGYCTFMNPTAREMTGYLDGEIGDKPLKDLIHSWQQDGTTNYSNSWPLLRVLQEKKELRGYEDIFNRKDGTVFQVTCAARPIYENETPVATLLEVRDITEEKRMKQRMQESVERQRLILEAMPQIAWTAMPTGEVTYYNQRWYDYTGQPRQQTELENWQAFTHPEESYSSLENILKVLASGEVNEIKIRIRRASDAAFRWHLVRATPIRNDQHQLILWIGTCTDIHDETLRETSLQEYNRKLGVMNRVLKDKNEELVRINNDLDNFVYTASHDLKSPVVNIEGFISILMKRLSKHEDEVEKKMLDMISESAKKLKRTINDLTEITKVQKDLQEPPVLLSFAEVLEDVSADLDLMIKESDAIVTTRLEVQTVEFTRKNLRSILYNLLSNAVKYRHPDRQPQVAISTSETEDFILFLIRDNGLGISSQQISKLFTMFKRFHSHVEGTGIGLYIVKRIIENNGGRIEVESQEEEGTTFKVYFKKRRQTTEVIHSVQERTDIQPEGTHTD
jgi:PAS domain S-box-containing protein